MKNGMKLRQGVSLALKLITAAAAAAGVILSALGGRNAFMGGGSVFMYFTIQSNIAVMLMLLAGAARMLKGSEGGRAWSAVRLVGTVAITLTGVVFCFVLAPTMSGSAWRLNNVLTHVLVPALTVADYFLDGLKDDCRIADIPWITVPPILYAIYAGTAYAAGWEFAPGVCYPYFFLNWGSPAGAFGFCEGLPYMGCMWWILALLVFLMAVGLLYQRLLKMLQRRVG